MVHSVDDFSSGELTEIRLTLGADTDLDQAVRWLERLWGVSLLFTAQLPAPLGSLIRAHVDPGRPSQLIALATLRRAIAADVGPPHNGVVGYRNTRLT